MTEQNRKEDAGDVCREAGKWLVHQWFRIRWLLRSGKHHVWRFEATALAQRHFTVELRGLPTRPLCDWFDWMVIAA